MRRIIMGTALALSLAVAGTAQADSNTTTFDGFDTGTVNGQHGWKATGPYDQAVEDVEGAKALRISNAVTSGSLGDMPYSAPVLIAAGENEANNVLVNEFKFRRRPRRAADGASDERQPDQRRWRSDVLRPPGGQLRRRARVLR